MAKVNQMTLPVDHYPEEEKLPEAFGTTAMELAEIAAEFHKRSIEQGMVSDKIFIDMTKDGTINGGHIMVFAYAHLQSVIEDPFVNMDLPEENKGVRP